MKINRNVLKVFLFFVFTFIFGCATSPTTGKQVFTFFNEKDEIEIGKKNYGPAIQQLNGEYHNQTVEEYVSGIGHKVAKITHRPQMPYEFRMVNNSTFNAFNIAGGKVAVHRGLLYAVNSESELAAVLGHELAHDNSLDVAKGYSKQLAISVLLPAADFMLSRESAHYRRYRSLYLVGAQFGVQLAILKFTRDNEAAADDIGQQYMVKAGYHPQGMVDAAKTMKSLNNSKPSFISDMLSSHPHPANREIAATERMNRLYANDIKTRHLIANTEEFSRVKAIMMDEKPAYDKHDQGVAALTQGNTAAAISYYNQALNLKPNEALFHADLGQAYMSQKQDSLAENHLKQANTLYPQFFKAKAYMGQLYYYQGRSQESASYLVQADALLPNSPVIGYMIGANYERMGQREAAAQYYNRVMRTTPDSEIGKYSQQRLVQWGYIKTQ